MIGDVVENPEAEHDVTTLDLGDVIEDVALDELVRITRDVALLQGSRSWCEPVTRQFRCLHATSTRAERREREPAVVTGKVEDGCTSNDVAIGVHQRDRL